MNKLESIKAFISYGGNELFSTLMGADIKRSEALDRLTTLLCMYSDRCRFINGRSKAYRYMLFKAKARGWLGVRSNDLHAYRLTGDDIQRLEEKTNAYIISGGALSKRANKAGFALALLSLLALAFFITYKRLASDTYKKHLLAYYSEQIVIEYVGKQGGDLVFTVSTTETGPLFVFMEHMPRLYYMTSDDEAALEIRPDKDILSTEDERSDYTTVPERLLLNEKDYRASFIPGRYRAEFEFYCQGENGEKIILPVIEKEIVIS